MPKNWARPNNAETELPIPSGQRAGMPFAIGGWQFDPNARTVSNGSMTKRLSPRAMKFIEVLSDRPEQVVRRDTLMDEIWPNVVVGDESLTQAVSEVRRALGNEGKRLIETISKSGYRLNGQVAVGENSEIGRTSTFSLDAYQMCLEARQLMLRGGRDVVVNCEVLTRKASKIAPEFAAGRAEHSIALSYRWLYQRGTSSAAEEAMAEAYAALQFQPDLSLAHTALAFSKAAAGRPDEAVSALETALQRDDRDAHTHFLGSRIMFALQNYEAATTFAERAAYLHPDDYWSLYFGARAAAAFDKSRSRTLSALCLQRVKGRLAADKTDARALNMKGPLLAALGNYEKAERAICAQSDRKTTLQIYDAVA
ncbi:MAG: winged helix-turn-helix domain-containing protein, partial [Pseudomonadota bacterium]